MSHYMVRVYRQEKQHNQSDRLYGVVETLENGEMSVFRSFDALWTLLSSGESVQSDIVGEKGWKEQVEKRRDPRFTYYCPVNYRIREDKTGSGEKGKSSGKLVNISRGGMSLETEDVSLSKGMLLEIQIPVAGLSISFPSLARVVRVAGSWSGKRRVGLQFIERMASGNEECA